MAEQCCIHWYIGTNIWCHKVNNHQKFLFSSVFGPINFIPYALLCPFLAFRVSCSCRRCPPSVATWRKQSCYQKQWRVKLRVSRTAAKHRTIQARPWPYNIGVLCANSQNPCPIPFWLLQQLKSQSLHSQNCLRITCERLVPLLTTHHKKLAGTGKKNSRQSSIIGFFF